MAYCLPSRDYKLFRMYKIYDDPQRMFTEVLYWKEEFKILSYEFKITPRCLRIKWLRDRRVNT